MTDFNTNNPFNIPKNYFQELEDSLIENVKATKVKNNFSTPNDYFDTLGKKILKEIYPEKKSLFTTKKLIISITSIAASLTILFILNTFETPQTLTQDQAFNDYLESYYIEEFDSYEMLSMLEDTEIEKIANSSLIP